MTKKNWLFFHATLNGKKMKKNFLSFLILIIYQFCSKFISDYEFAYEYSYSFLNPFENRL